MPTEADRQRWWLGDIPPNLDTPALRALAPPGATGITAHGDGYASWVFEEDAARPTPESKRLTAAQRAQACSTVEDGTRHYVPGFLADEAIDALEDAGWTLVPPARGLPLSTDETPTEADATSAGGVPRA